MGESGKKKVFETSEKELRWWTAELHDIRSKCNDGNERTVTIQWYTVVSRDNLEE